MTWAIPFFLLAWFLSGKGSAKDLTPRAPGAPRPKPPPAPPPAAAPRPTVTTTTLAKTAPPPWPQVVPAGLPPFPGGWEPDSPPGPGVAARAAQLLPTLWRHGAGTIRTEQTGGRWITYRAVQMGTKRGVVAYRLRPTVSPAPTASPAARVVPVSRPAPTRTALPTLRRGSRGESVRLLQSRLGIPADGAFGPQTEAAVRRYQAANGLASDGIVGPKTWAALYGGQA